MPEGSGEGGMKALIKVGYGCNEHCTFCHTQDVRHIDGDASEIDAKIDRAHALGHSMVVLSGGEATIRPELLLWADRVAAAGMDLGLVTNGLMLAYPELLQQLLERRLRYVYMSVHGGEAKVHDRLVRRSSFDAAVQALRNVSGRGLDVTANCVVTRQNVKHLLGLVELVAPMPDVRLKFSWVEPKGGAAHLFDTLVPRLEDAAAAVCEALARWDALTGAPARGVHGGFPLCTMPGYESRYDDLRTHRYWTMSEVGEPDFFPIDDRNKLKPEHTCADCGQRGGCPGLFRVYHERFGAHELRPVPAEARANAFDYVFESLVTTGYDGTEGCPVARGGPTPYDRARHLFVRHEARIGRYLALSRDFDDEEIEAIKFGTGQIYLDASRKTAPDDFASDLVKLERSPICGDCPHLESCPGMFEPRFEDVFSRDDAQVRTRLDGLRGDVLDVGFGSMPYLDVLGPRARAEELRYVGVDPDPSAVARVARRFPEADLRVGDLQQLADAERFDHGLVLRSWNHLPDPTRAVQRLAHHIRPHGSLLVVDNTAFGLARTAAQTRRARHSPAAWEHFRNDDAARAHARIGAEHFELVERVDIRSAGSNQWMLRYTRRR